MRIARLDLIAFGPFTGRSLTLDAGDSDFHVIHGPNEAGKSAALRGLKALLYGVPGNTRDDFIHDKPKLRIGGLLRDTDGRELEVVRRKGRAKTLLDAAGQPMEEDRLIPFLHGVGEEVFETLFGIDHPALVRGGEEILKQRGEIGQALFSAALGSQSLHAVLERLRAEADALFRPRGSTQKINAAVKQYQQLKKEIQRHSLSSREWEARQQAWEQAGQELATVESKLRHARAEMHRLKRLQRALPRLARRRVLLESLASMSEVIALSEEFPTRRRELQRERDKAQTLLARTRPRLETAQRELAKLNLRSEVLRHAERIEALHAEFGAYLKAQRDSPGLRAQRQQLLEDADALLKSVRPDAGPVDIDAMRPAASKRQRIAELGRRQVELQSALRQAADSRREAEDGLEACRGQLAGLPEARSSVTLHGAIDAARKLGDIDEVIQSERAECDTLRDDCLAMLSRLSPWRGNLEAVAGLATPHASTLDGFEQRDAKLQAERAELRDRKRDIVEEQHTVARQLDEMLRVGDIPSEDDLDQAREQRDRIWRQLRDRWSTGETLDNHLSEDFTRYIETADELADRLRREAERVNRRAGLQAMDASLTQARQALEQEHAAHDQRRARFDADWRALWASLDIQPQAPREMRAWLARLETLREHARRLREMENRLQQREQRRDAHIRELLASLRKHASPETSSNTLESLLRQSERVVHLLDDATDQHTALEKERRDLETRLTLASNAHDQASQAMEGWEREWRKWLAVLGLPADSTPVEADDIIEKLREAFKKQAEAEALGQRLQAIETDAAAFASEVRAVSAAVDAELAGLPVDEAVSSLNALLSEERAAASRRGEIEKQVERYRLDIQDAEAIYRAMSERLDVLCHEAGCQHPEQLEQAEQRSVEHRGLRVELETLERELEEAGEGITLGELEAQAARVDADSLPAQIAEQEAGIDNLETERTKLAETRGREARELELMDGGAKAAGLAEQAQAMLTGLRADAERYARTRLAERILHDQIERYRRENQGPLLGHASEYFARLTQGAFERLVADIDEKDRPVLIGVRSNGESVAVTGMSAGTRDQLYLALRLASLEKYMRAAEPMPFIVDDVLIEFDDKRSAAALQALADLAGKTQVILFTHHDRLVEQARELRSATYIHRL